MLQTPFLTKLDSRAQIKGSRDPLGVQPIWSRLGRQVVGNLTTVSTSVRDFTVLLLGHYFVERVADEGGTHGDLATFLKWEQLAAYARAQVNGDFEFRGTERVRARLGDGHSVRLADDADAQILGNQKIYGLWGLYTVPARASGLLEGDPARLTPEAREVVEESLLPALESAGARIARGIVERLSGREHKLDLRKGSRDRPILEGVAKVLKDLRPPERALFRAHLLHGGAADADRTRGTQGRQRLFAELLTETLVETDWRLTPESLRALALRARRRGELGEDLSERLEKIRTAELLMAPAVAFFERLLACDGQEPRVIAEGVKQHWGSGPRKTIDVAATQEIERELRTWTDDAASGERWVKLAAAFREGRYRDAVDVALEQNAAVMKARSAAAPWATVREGKLVVSFRDEQLLRLPEADELSGYWRHAYFIESLRTVAGALRGGQ